MSEEKKRVQFNDVVNALKVTIDKEGNITNEPTDPFKTNSGKLQKIIGHGSNITVQKHLNTIRDNINNERMKELGSAKSEAPKAPKELVESLWAEAWMTAQVSTLSRIDSLNVEREGLLLKSNAQSNDIEALSNQVDDFEFQVTELKNVIENNILIVEKLEIDAEQKVENLRVELTNENTELEGSKKVLESDLINLRHEVESVKKDAAHQKEISDREAEIAKVTMQGTIDNLTEQVSELKAMRISGSIDK